MTIPASVTSTPTSVEGPGTSPRSSIPSRMPPVTSWVAMRLTVVAQVSLEPPVVSMLEPL